jgi:hypothetical protein
MQVGNGALSYHRFLEEFLKEYQTLWSSPAGLQMLMEAGNSPKELMKLIYHVEQFCWQTNFASTRKQGCCELANFL